MDGIRRLALATNEQALQLLQLQMAAYRVEAELVGFEEIPPLMDSIFTIQASKEAFYGYFIGDTLAGAISFESDGSTVTICRMMVHPHYFRRGIASALLAYVLEHVPASLGYSVSTGALNAPALRLYERHGFKEHSSREIAPGIQLILLTKCQL